MPPQVLLALLVVGAVAGSCLAGGRLILAGWRGRVVDRHPRCRACGYDLVGHPVRPDRCPECAGPLLGRGRVRLGRRRLQAGRIAAGITLVLLTATALLLPQPLPAGTGAAAATGVAGRAPRLMRAIVPRTGWRSPTRPRARRPAPAESNDVPRRHAASGLAGWSMAYSSPSTGADPELVRLDDAPAAVRSDPWRRRSPLPEAVPSPLPASRPRAIPKPAGR